MTFLQPHSLDFGGTATPDRKSAENPYTVGVAVGCERAEGALATPALIPAIQSDADFLSRFRPNSLNSGRLRLCAVLPVRSFKTAHTGFCAVCVPLLFDSVTAEKKNVIGYHSLHPRAFIVSLASRRMRLTESSCSYLHFFSVVIFLFT